MNITDTLKLAFVPSPGLKLRDHIIEVCKYGFLACKNIGAQKNAFLLSSSEVDLEQHNIWSYFSRQLEFVLRHISVKDYLKAPVVAKTTFGVGQMPETDIARSPYSFENIQKTAKLLSAYYPACSDKKWANWLARYQYTNERLLKVANIDYAYHQSLATLEIGSGIGVNSLVESLQVHKGIVNINYDLPEMLLLQMNIKNALSANNNDSTIFDNINYFSSLNALANVTKDLDYKILTYWAFTEFPLAERGKFVSLFRNAKYVIIVSNPSFEGTDNFLYIQKLSEEIGKKVYETFVENPANLGYVNRHKAFLLL